MKLKEIKIQFLKLFDKAYSSANYKYSLLITALLLINFILLGVDSLNWANDPEDYVDQTAYLGEANFIDNHGGIMNFLNLCFTGKYKQANQHPLYILFITPFASRDISFLINAKILSFVIGIFLLLSLFIIARKMYGDLIASIAVFAIMLNHLFLEYTSLAGCESLLMLLTLLCIYFLMEGFKNNKYWAYAGVIAGLVYLTKGTGLLLIPGFLLSSIYIYKLKIFKNKYFWSFFIFFVLVSSPLLVRNILVYQDPFFNVNKYIAEYGREQVLNSAYLVFSPVEGAGLWQFEKIEDKNINPQLKSTYIETFTNLYKRFKDGIGTHFNTFFNSLNLLNIDSWILGLFLFLLFILGISRERNFGGKIYVIITLLVFFVAFSFVRSIPRYFLPLIPLIWIYIALGILTLLDFINKKFFFKSLKVNIISYVPHFLILILIINLSYLLSTKAITNPTKSVSYSENRLDLLNWMRDNLNENDKYTLGPNLYWQLDKGTWVVPPVLVREDFSKLNSFMKRHDISYIIISSQNLAREGSVDYSKLTQNYFELDPKEGIVEKRNIVNWDLVYRNQKKPVEFLVYKVK